MMDEILNYSSDTSDEIEDELEASFGVTHNNNHINNNGSFIEQKVLSTQDVFGMMKREMKLVQDVTDVSQSYQISDHR